jgi:hypothetical protein
VGCVHHYVCKEVHEVGNCGDSSKGVNEVDVNLTGALAANVSLMSSPKTRNARWMLEISLICMVLGL